MVMGWLASCGILGGRESQEECNSRLLSSGGQPEGEEGGSQVNLQPTSSSSSLQGGPRENLQLQGELTSTEGWTSLHWDYRSRGSSKMEKTARNHERKGRFGVVILLLRTCPSIAESIQSDTQIGAAQVEEADFGLNAK